MKKSICVILAVVLATLMVYAQQYNHPRFVEGGTQHFNPLHPDSLEHEFALPGDPTLHRGLNPNLKSKTTPSSPHETIYRPKFATKDDGKIQFTFDDRGYLLIEEGIVGYKYRYSYSYDDNGNRLSFTRGTVNNGVFAPFNRFIYTYDGSGKLLTETEEYFHAPQEWRVSTRSTFSYLNSGKILSQIIEKPYNGGWKILERYTYTYDSSENLLTMLYEVRFGEDGIIQPNERFTYTYDNNGNRLSILRERGEDGVFYAFWPSYRFTYTYDSNGNMITELKEYSRGVLDSVLIPSSRNTYSYSDNGNKKTKLTEEFRLSKWEPTFLGSFQYDNKRNLISDTTYYYLSYSKMWELSAAYNYLYSYDSNDNLISIHRKSGLNYNRLSYSYDNYNNCTSVKYEWGWGDNIVWKPEVTNLTLYYNNGKSSIIQYGSFLNVEYTAITLATSDPNSLPETITLSQNYPNPFNPATAISFSLPSESFTSLKVYNTLGEHVQTLVNGVLQSGVHNISFDATNLPSGVYVYRLDAGDVSLSKKMMLMK